MSKIKPQSPTVGKEWGITGLPPGNVKGGGFPKVDKNKSVAQIEQLGVRWAWSRAAFCPCMPANSQTDQPDPNCVKCGGRGFFYFGPNDYSPGDDVGELSQLQKAILADDGAAVIRGLFTRSTQQQNPYDMIGNWVRGSMFVTVRPENRIGYYDRLVHLDSSVVYYETVEMPATGLELPLRYRAICVNTIQTVDDRFEQDVDFVVETGKVVWNPLSAPTAATRLAVHYEMHPTWLIVEHPHVTRQSPGNQKLLCDPEDRKKFPRGVPQRLPIQAMVQLEFLAGDRTNAAEGGT